MGTVWQKQVRDALSKMFGEHFVAKARKGYVRSVEPPTPTLSGKEPLHLGWTLQ